MFELRFKVTFGKFSRFDRHFKFSTKDSNEAVTLEPCFIISGTFGLVRSTLEHLDK